jgi:hypothetical protein
MLEITKFKLANLGRNGITIEGRETIQMSDNAVCIDKVKRERNLILVPRIVELIQEMKYYFFNCTGHWMVPFNRYYDITNHILKPLEYDEENKIKAGQELLRSLWNRTEITGISYLHNGFVITGSIEVVEGKKLVINTPFISEEDDLGFYSSAIEKMGECIREIVNYFTINALPAYDPKLILKEEEMKGLSVEEISNKVLEKLVDRNMIILIKDDEEQKAIPETTKKRSSKLSTSTKNIDSKNLPEVKDHNSESQSGEHNDNILGDDPDEIVKQNLALNSRNVYGPGVSGKDFPGNETNTGGSVILSDINTLEHSENLGIDTENENKEKAEWEE